MQGHPERISLPGLETTSGPLGEGLAQGIGMALSAKMDRADWRVYVVTSDAEHQCGLHWEAMMTAAKFGLDNLTCVIDRNFIQIDGSTEDVMPLEPLADKYRAFNWEVLECDGNDIGRVRRHRRARQGGARQAAGDRRQHRARQGRLVHGGRLHSGTASRPRRTRRTARCASCRRRAS